MTRSPSKLASLTVSSSWFVAVLSILIAFSPLAIDLYLPALPSIANALDASEAEIQLSLSAYLIGFCASQFLWGPLGDWLGRRGPITAGITLFIIGSVGCAFSTTAHELAGWRFVQAVGAGSPPALARAMVRDVYTQDEAARTLSLMMLIMGAAPMVAPLVGAQLLLWVGWQSNFWFLAIFGVIALIALWTIPETLPAAKRRARNWRQVALSYSPLLRSGRYLSYALTGTCFSGAMFTYIAGTPFVYIEYFGVPPEYFGLLFGINVAGMMVFNVVNRHLVKRIGSQRALQWGATGCSVAGLVLAACGITGAFGLAGIVVPLLVFLSMNGIVAANAMAGGMSAVPGTAGTAAGLSGSLQYGAGALLSWLLGVVADGSPGPMVLIIAVMGLGCFFFACIMPGWLQRTPRP